MSALPDEVELHKKHEEILGKRAELLRQMETRTEPLGSCRRRRQESRAARERNGTLLEDLQRIEERLREIQLPHPDVQALETRYWASVEQSIPEWEQLLLGGTPHPADAPAQTPRGARQRSDPGRPPRPKPRPAVSCKTHRDADVPLRSEFTSGLFRSSGAKN